MKKIINIGIPLILGIVIGWFIKERNWVVFLPALATLLAAFSGAKYAFKLQINKEKEDTKKRNVVNGNIAIFNISRMINTLWNVQNKIIDPVRNHQYRFIQMKPTLHLGNEDIQINIEKLYFLLETDDRNLLGELAIEEERYHSALDTINERSQFHIKEIQPSLERARIDKDCTIDQIETALSERQLITIKQITEDAIDTVDKTLKSLERVADKLRASLKKEYPNKIIIKLEIEP